MDMMSFTFGLCKFTYRSKDRTDISCPSVDFVINKGIDMKVKSDDNVSADGTQLTFVEREMTVTTETKEDPSDKNVEITKVTKKYGPVTKVNVTYDDEGKIMYLSVNHNNEDYYSAGVKVQKGTWFNTTIVEQKVCPRNSSWNRPMQTYMESLVSERKREEIANKLKSKYSDKKKE